MGEPACLQPFHLYSLTWSDGMTALGGCDMNLKGSGQSDIKKQQR
jgi:hypothetical protein